MDGLSFGQNGVWTKWHEGGVLVVRKKKEKKEDLEYVKVGEQGRITIPQKFRQELGIEVGRFVKIVKKKKYLEIYPIRGDEE